MPRLEEHERQALWANFPPRSLASVVSVRDVLQDYAGAHPAVVCLAICLLYVLMQTFAIPGTIFLSLLSGALFGRILGFVLCAVISTLGSSACYALSWAIGRPLARAIWPDRLLAFQAEIASRRNDLFSYMVFLRVTPILPNTFINVASPVVGVPLPIFMGATLLGCAPNNFMAANAGAHLAQLKTMADLYDAKMVGLGLLVGAVAILPIWLKRKGAPASGTGQQPPRSHLQ